MQYKIENAYAIDFETTLIGPQQLAPKSICLSLANKGQGAFLIANGDENYNEYQRNLIEYVYTTEQEYIVIHNAKFDMWVFLNENIDLYDKVCELYDRGQIIDTILVEKLINLSTTGRIATEPPRDMFDEDAKGKKIEYDLASVLERYTGKDIKKSKEAEDAVRTRYQELDGTPAARYPRNFRDYAIDDSKYLLTVWDEQLKRANHIKDALNVDVFKTLAHRCSLDFHMYRYSIEGVRTDPKKIKELRTMLEDQLSKERLNLLYPPYVPDTDDEKFWSDFEKVEIYLKRDRNKGFLKPCYPPHPSFSWSCYKGCPKEKDEYGILKCDDRCFRRATKSHVEGCKKKQDKFNREWLCDCPPKMKGAEEYVKAAGEFVLDDDGNKIERYYDKTNGEKLKKHIISLWIDRPGDFDIHFTDGAYDKKGQFIDPTLNNYTYYQENGKNKEEAIEAVTRNWSKLKHDSEWLDIYAFKDPVLEQFAHRASLIKLQTTELPRMTNRKTGEIAEVVHGNFDVLKETGRTSGFAGSLYPSANLQNVHKMARTCFRARKDHWILSTDYSSLEFVSAAYRAYTIFGESVYKKIFDNGWDAHGYLAAQRAYLSEQWFREDCDGKGISSEDDEAIYHEFHKYKAKDKFLCNYEGKIDEKGNPVPKYFHAHYRNSAKPIGLGILGGMGAKTIAHVSAADYGIEMSISEAEEYKAIWERIFAPEAELVRMINKEMKDYDFSTKKKSKFKYETPMGMVRPNCSFAACSNGFILQSPSAEGATLAVIEVAKACWSPNSTSILKGNFHPWAFVHDEILGDVTADPEIATKVAKELERIMCECLNKVLPNVSCAADSALSLNWDKKAKDVFNADGLLVPFEVLKNEILAEQLNYVKKEK